jgi:hypothetical protein
MTKMRKLLLIVFMIGIILGPCLAGSQVKILDDFESHGIWKVDRPNHRCLIDSGIWSRWPFEIKEKCLTAIYIEEKTCWKIYDYMSGKLLGEVNSLGTKVYP